MLNFIKHTLKRFLVSKKPAHNKIIVVDENDTVIGALDLFAAIKKGLIRRVVRILVFNDKDEILIQRRGSKVLTPLKFDQSAAGHVDEGESYEIAAARELEEELGIKGHPLILVMPPFRTKHFFNGVYRVDVSSKLEIKFNREEVDSIEWIKFSDFTKIIKTNPEEFTASFVEAWHIVCDKIKMI
ncbi:MAG: NUDIX domain-containing protein [Patescibacteria group bacterium]